MRGPQITVRHPCILCGCQRIETRRKNVLHPRERQALWMLFQQGAKGIPAQGLHHQADTWLFVLVSLKKAKVSNNVQVIEPLKVANQVAIARPGVPIIINAGYDPDHHRPWHAAIVGLRTGKTAGAEDSPWSFPARCVKAFQKFVVAKLA